MGRRRQPLPARSPFALSTAATARNLLQQPVDDVRRVVSAYVLQSSLGKQAVAVGVIVKADDETGQCVGRDGHELVERWRQIHALGRDRGHNRG